jgi:hypothetical protein
MDGNLVKKSITTTIVNDNNNETRPIQYFFVKNYDQSTLAQWLKESVVR